MNPLLLSLRRFSPIGWLEANLKLKFDRLKLNDVDIIL